MSRIEVEIYRIALAMTVCRSARRIMTNIVAQLAFKLNLFEFIPSSFLQGH